MTGHRTLVFLIPLLFASSLIAQDCSSFNQTFTNNQANSNTLEHSTTLTFNGPSGNSGNSLSSAQGFHNVSSTSTTVCNYAPQENTSACQTECASTVIGDSAEFGSATGFHVHTPAFTTKQGEATSNGGSATCGSEVAGAVRSCTLAIYLATGCDLSVSLSASAAGLGGSVSYSSSALWGQTLSYSQTCNPQVAAAAPNGQCNPLSGPPSGGSGSGYWVWSIYSCQWVYQPCWENCLDGLSPLIIDTDGSGFHVSDLKDGVVFDFFGDGKPVQLSWPTKGSTNGWLALDRNHNGKIDDSRELFGNLTAQDTTHTKVTNGFNALAVFDFPAYGGNGDGFIDAKDAIWKSLLIWIDANHDGISQPAELHPISTMGIARISLAYTSAPLTDAAGNQFKYKGSLVPVNDDDVDRTLYDVYLLGTNP